MPMDVISGKAELLADMLQAVTCPDFEAEPCEPL